MAYTETAAYIRSVGWTAVAAWAATTAYTVGQIVRQLAAPSLINERCFICTTSGTSGSTEPSWSSAIRGAAYTDGTAHWIECTGLPAVNGDNNNTNAWAPNMGAIALGWIIKNIANTYYFICTTAGTGGTGAEPSWVTTAGSTTTDASVTWTCIGAASAFTTRWAAPHGAICGFMASGNSGSSYWLANAGMNIFVGDDHTETAGTQLYQAALNCSLLSVDHTATFPLVSTNLKAGAAVLQSGGGGISFPYVNGNVELYAYGFTVAPQTGAAYGVGDVRTGRMKLEKFTIGPTTGFPNLGGQAGADGSYLELKDCTIALGGWGNNNFPSTRGGTTKLENVTFTTTASGGSVMPVFSGGGALTILEGCDFSALNTAAIGRSNIPLLGSSPNSNWLVKDCVLGVGMIAVSNMNWNTQIDLNRVDTGTAYIRNERWNMLGTLITSTSVVRTGGAVDGTTPVSHQIATSSSNTFIGTSFYALPLAIWNAVIGSNRNVTLYGIANDSRLPTNAEVWFDCEYLGSSTSLKASYVRGAPVVLATPTALTADTSAWDSTATARANTTAYVLGAVIKTASNVGRVFFCTTAGTSAGSEPGGYASAVDGGSVTDGTATFRAGCRFSQTLTLSSPQPQQPGYLYVYPKFGRASTTYYLDPLIKLS